MSTRVSTMPRVKLSRYTARMKMRAKGVSMMVEILVGVRVFCSCSLARWHSLGICC